MDVASKTLILIDFLTSILNIKIGQFENPLKICSTVSLNASTQRSSDFIIIETLSN